MESQDIIATFSVSLYSVHCNIIKDFKPHFQYSRSVCFRARSHILVRLTGSFIWLIHFSSLPILPAFLHFQEHNRSPYRLLSVYFSALTTLHYFPCKLSLLGMLSNQFFSVRLFFKLVYGKWDSVREAERVFSKTCNYGKRLTI